MSNGETTLLLELEKFLGEELSVDSLMRDAIALSAEQFGEANTITQLRFLADLKNALGDEALPFAVGLLMSLPHREPDWRILLAERQLPDLVNALSYFAPVQVAQNQFKTASNKWKAEVEQLILAPDYVKLLYLASLVKRVVDKDWHNFLQQQQLVERACLAASLLGEHNESLQTWVKLLHATCEISYKSASPKRGTLNLSLS
ncbi:hypothetical protein [Pseudoalteromonas umbrosa]|uniref:hypothetical protein n=1 Tax=Pseudoalteromonas umbrosa TaxID=3048489 RepID=UPI0024C38C96|nr:hypothetical protein [Pseudoalteromonas sp. B95]MDK1290179.1 hypothetical protein [Pseudoalteromonas sp. B95]